MAHQTSATRELLLDVHYACGCSSLCVPGRRLFLTKEEVELAKDRLLRSGHSIGHTPITMSTFKKVFSSWKIYILTIWDVLYWNLSQLRSTSRLFAILMSSSKLTPNLLIFRSIPLLSKLL